MKRIEHLMIGLDLNPLDDRLLSFAREFSHLLDVKKVTGAHIIPAILIGDVVKVEAGKMLRPVAPAVGKIEKEVARLTEKWFKPTAINFNTKVLEGRPFQEILKLLEANHIDLLVLGKKDAPFISRVNAQKVARKSHCDLLIVPEDSYPFIEKILVPIDFSENSTKALERALFLADQLDNKTVVNCVHIIEPLEKYMDQKERPEIQESDLPEELQIKISAFKQANNFSKERFQIDYFENRVNSIAGSIHDYSLYTESDLIVIGAQGHNFSERLLFGSVTEDMVKNYFYVPVYIAR